MLTMPNQRRRLSATQRRHFAPFTGMHVDGLAATRPARGWRSGCDALPRRFSAPRLRHCETVASAALGAAAVSSGWVHAAGRPATALIHD